MNQCLIGDVRDVLPKLEAKSVQMCVTSPPYWGLRDYGVEGQIGVESTPEEYVANILGVFREVRRVLRDDGTLWLNLGDSYASSPPGNKTKGVSAKSTLHGVMSDKYRETLESGHAKKRNTVVGNLKPKDLIGIPWRVAFALHKDGWYLRQDIIWHKPNPMPETVKDRCTKAHEYVFLLSKSARYYFDAEAIKEPLSPKTLTVNTTPTKGTGVESTGEKLNSWMAGNGGRYHPDKANKRSVWTVSSQPYHEAHFATFPPKLIEPCILAGSRPGDMVLDPFLGSGTTGKVCEQLGRKWVGIELNPDYAEMAKRRTRQMGLSL